MLTDIKTLSGIYVFISWILRLYNSSQVYKSKKCTFKPGNDMLVRNEETYNDVTGDVLLLHS